MTEQNKPTYFNFDINGTTEICCEVVAVIKTTLTPLLSILASYERVGLFHVKSVTQKDATFNEVTLVIPIRYLVDSVDVVTKEDIESLLVYLFGHHAEVDLNGEKYGRAVNSTSRVLVPADACIGLDYFIKSHADYGHELAKSPDLTDEQRDDIKTVMDVLNLFYRGKNLQYQKYIFENFDKCPTIVLLMEFVRSDKKEDMIVVMPVIDEYSRVTEEIYINGVRLTMSQVHLFLMAQLLGQPFISFVIDKMLKHETYLKTISVVMGNLDTYFEVGETQMETVISAIEAFERIDDHYTLNMSVLEFLCDKDTNLGFTEDMDFYKLDFEGGFVVLVDEEINVYDNNNKLVQKYFDIRNEPALFGFISYALYRYAHTYKGEYVWDNYCF